MIAALSAGFVLGLGGSAHCAGMCGPLMFLARRGRGWHHAGRILVYVLVGTLAGGAGGFIAHAEAARLLSAAVGLSLIARALGVRFNLRTRGRSILQSRMSTAMAAAAAWRGRHPTAGAFAFGAVNGVLPCGLVYVAAAASAAFGDAVSGAAFMAAFGAGTLPALALVVWSAQAGWSRVRLPVRWAAPAAIALVGVLLVARGLWPAYGHVPAAHGAVHLTAR